MFLPFYLQDLHRTFPENIHFNSGGSGRCLIPKLRRILLAFSFYFPDIGYCQSLNFIGGMLLIFMEEEEAFWMLITLINNVVTRGTYGEMLEGVRVDQDILISLISTKLPHMMKKLSQTDIPPISVITSTWFLTLFLNSMPVEVRSTGPNVCPIA
jgi:hypothetical protein